MAATAFVKSNTLTLAAYAGDAKTLLAWTLTKARATRLAGFTIACKPPKGPAFFLRNRLGFEHPERHAQVAAAPPDASVNAPFHKFRWLHVPAAPEPGGEPATGTYTYTVTPRYFDAHGAMLPLDPKLGAQVKIRVAPFAKGTMELAFTRGYVQSQAYAERFGPTARIRPDDDELLYDTAQVAGKGPDGKAFTYAEEYRWLGFTARAKIFALLDEVLANPALRLDVFAYDLNEPDLMAALLELARQGRVRVILDKAALHHSTKDPKPEDRFADRFATAATGAAAIKRGRFKRYAHDKVLVVSDAKGPLKVLTGSTNFSVTGLYVNSNHVLVFTDRDTAAEYGRLFQQVWDDDVRLAPFLASAFSTGEFAPAAVPERRITFAPHVPADAQRILDAIAARIAREGEQPTGARGTVLFAVMELDNGTSPVYAALNALHANQAIFSYGISDNPDGIALYVPGQATGVLVTGKPTKTRLPPPFNQVPSIGLGHQIHHKFVICGFNGKDPVVFCGSSNLALGGEESNGDNLVELRDADVVTAFALEALALVDHFQFLDGVAAHADAKRPVAPAASKREAAAKAGWFLSTTDRWTRPYFDPQDLRHRDRLLFAGPAAKPPA